MILYQLQDGDQAGLIVNLIPIAYIDPPSKTAVFSNGTILELSDEDYDAISLILDEYVEYAND